MHEERRWRKDWGRAEMSDTDSFIDEVSEEVTRDRLYHTLRKWAWLGALCVVLLVGGAAFNEYRKASQRSAAQAFGDSLVAGIEAEDEGQALAAIETDDASQDALARHLAASEALENDNSGLALEQLGRAGANSDAPEIYRALAQFKLALALPPETPVEERQGAFEALTAPGAPFRHLAMEQIALISVSEGARDVAITQLQELYEEAGITAGLQRRVSELIVALGAELPES